MTMCNNVTAKFGNGSVGFYNYGREECTAKIEAPPSNQVQDCKKFQGFLEFLAAAPLISCLPEPCKEVPPPTVPIGEGQGEVVFNEQKVAIDKYIAELYNARSSIHIFADYFSNENIIDAIFLIYRSNPRIDLEILIHRTCSNRERNEVVQSCARLENELGRQRVKSGGKGNLNFTLIDDQTVLAGTFTYTQDPHKDSYLFIVRGNREILDEFRFKFDRYWNGADDLPQEDWPHDGCYCAPPEQ